MNCTTCSGMMERVAEDAFTITFWCPRCGTIGGRAPRLVERCRDFAKKMDDPDWSGEAAALWKIAGIAESINP
jgi:predicted RNA-binding Zn-ribbon protein involved in translation (DUF1610 family)